MFTFGWGEVMDTVHKEAVGVFKISAMAGANVVDGKLFFFVIVTQDNQIVVVGAAVIEVTIFGKKLFTVGRNYNRDILNQVIFDFG